MADDQIRCFVGISAADMALQTLLASQIDHYRAQPAFANIRWTPVTFLHLTLCFLGNQSRASLSTLAGHLDGCLPAVDAFVLPLERCCGFPEADNIMAKSRIVAAMPVLTPALAALQGRVVDAVRAAGLAPEARPYVPHITLGRVTHGQALPALHERLAGSGEVRAVSLYRSELLPGGSHYSVIQAWPLAAPGIRLSQGSPTL